MSISNVQNGNPPSLFARISGSATKAPTTSSASSSRPNTSSGRSIAALDPVPYDLLPTTAFQSISRKSSFNLSHKSPRTSAVPHHPSSHSKSRTPSISLTSFGGSQSALTSPERPAGPVRSKSRPPVTLQGHAPIWSERRRSLTLTKSHSSTKSSDNKSAASSADLLGQFPITAGTAGDSDRGERTRDSFTSTRAYSDMLANYGNGQYRQAVPYGTMNVGSMIPGAPGLVSPTMENITYQHIQEMATKRISTLDYLRKAHEGRVYWFNTLLFTKADLQKMPYFEARKLARRATNFLLLGLSLPTVLDLNSNNALEYLRTLNALLSEFENYQVAHPPDGTSSTLSRARIPQMFKRTIGATGSRSARRTSGAADIGLPYSTYESANESSSTINHPVSTFPSSENDLLPGEEYIYLLTPSLPFDPDFYETFATLCDVLIDVYTTLLKLVTGPQACSAAVAEAFTNADKKVRKIIVQGVVKEFEDASRAGAKGEIGGIGKVVLGGLV